MYILSNHTIRLSPKVTGFNGESAKNSVLVNPSGVVVSKFYTESIPVKNTYTKGSVSSTQKTESITQNDNLVALASGDQKASAIEALPVWLNTKVLYLVSLIIVGTVLIFIVRKKDDIQVSFSKTKDGYEIIE